MENRKKASEKQREKFQRSFRRQKEWHNLLKEYGGDILDSDNFNKTKEYIQHGNMTVNSHCINVARYSLAISRKLGIPCNQRELVRGALLHDYFLYDWHDRHRSNRKRLHGFYHPGIALRNASSEYDLTRRERDIIKKHMWPLTVVPPRCREAWIVTAADKYCSLLETAKLHRGHGSPALQSTGKTEAAHGSPAPQSTGKTEAAHGSPAPQSTGKTEAAHGSPALQNTGKTEAAHGSPAPQRAGKAAAAHKARGGKKSKMKVQYQG